MDERKFELDFDELKIDQYALDKEWILQPHLYLKWASELARAQTELDRQKKLLEITEAELDLDIRKFPDKYGVPKVTEAMVRAILVQQDEFKAAHDRFVSQRETVAIIQAAVNGLEHKKKALDNLVQLWIKGYYAEPYVPEEAKEIAGDREREVQEESLGKNPRLARRRGN